MKNGKENIMTYDNQTSCSDLNLINSDPKLEQKAKN